MKSKTDPTPSTRATPADAFAIPEAVWPNEAAIEDILSGLAAQKPAAAPQPARAMTFNEAKTDYFKVIVAVATNVWRAKMELFPEGAGDFPDSIKHLKHHVDSIYQTLADFGIVIRDHTGEPYDESPHMKVVATKPTQGLDRKRVSETLLPSVFWNERLIQVAEVKVATPLPGMPVSEPQLHRS